MIIMLEAMIKINDDALLNRLCIFVCVFGHLFDQKIFSSIVHNLLIYSVDFLEIRKEQ